MLAWDFLNKPNIIFSLNLNGNLTINKFQLPYRFKYIKKYQTNSNIGK